MQHTTFFKPPPRDLDQAPTATSLRFPIITKSDPALSLLTQSPFIATLELGKTPNPKPQTPIPKPQTPNPKPQTPNQVLLLLELGAGQRLGRKLHTRCQVVGCGLWVVGCGLWVVGCGLWVCVVVWVVVCG